ncbi:MAG TPA: ABC transporter permease, partial [Candidatus Acidoferrales bacterium]|nr:ABC transporter permease [Candidatus Acidoferrales bacterium]
MNWHGRIFHRKRISAELSAEMRAHLDEKTSALISEGTNPREARLSALRELGNVTRIEETARDVWRWPTLESWIADFRFAGRILRKSPGFAAIAILTLSIAIGANTSILAVMNAALRPAMPYPQVEQLVSVYNRNLRVAGDYAEFVSQPFWRDMRERNHTMQDVAAYTWTARMNLTGDGGAAVRIRTARLSANYFSVLGNAPMLGRSFEDEDGLPGHDRVAIISNALWRERYGARADFGAIELLLDRQKFSVVGVLPADYRAGRLGDRMDVFLPLQTTGAEASRRDLRSVILLGRIKEGTAFAAAQQDLESIAKADAAAFPATDGGWDANVTSLRHDLEPGGRPRFMVFLGLAALILLVACLNVSLLLLARGEGRRHETLVRLSLGATRGRLVRLRACESGLIALCSTGLALLVAGWGRRLMLAYTPAEFLNGIH